MAADQLLKIEGGQGPNPEPIAALTEVIHLPAFGTSPAQIRDHRCSRQRAVRAVSSHKYYGVSPYMDLSWP
jgi:hypothetical protein